MRILVTGHKGFIGGHIFSYLTKNNDYEVSGIDIGDGIPQGRFDLIIHMAARGLIRKSIEMPYEYFDDDLALTLRFLDKARKENSTFVFPTSGSSAKPTNPYSLSKVHSEQWIELYRKLYNTKAYVLRFFNIYGPGSQKGSVFLFTRAAIEGKEAIVYGDGTHKRDYFYVGDMEKVIDLIANEKIEPGDYQVGTGIGTSVNDLIHIVEKVTGKKINVKFQPYVLEEAEALFATKPIIKNVTPLDQGIKKVEEYVRSLNH